MFNLSSSISMTLIVLPSRFCLRYGYYPFSQKSISLFYSLSFSLSFSLERSFYFLYLFLDNISPLLRKLLNSSYFRNSSITGTVTFGFCMGSCSVIVSL